MSVCARLALTLAETALELLARRQPLYPLDLVRAMRTQRPMCIQNAVSRTRSIFVTIAVSLVLSHSDTRFLLSILFARYGAKLKSFLNVC